MSGSQQSSGRDTGAGSVLRAVDGLHPDWLSDEDPADNGTRSPDSAGSGDSAGTSDLTGVAADTARATEAPESFAIDYDGDQLDLAERNSLRRVAGLSTQLADISEVEYRDLQLERVVLVGVWTSGTAVEAENSLVELKSLAETAGAEVLDGLVQRRQKPDIATYIGSGKVDEVRAVVSSTEADTVICDGELSPAQLRNLEERLKVKVIDRTGLILDIFAQHARSREGRAQVELAQLSYLLPRLRGWGGNLSRQAGGRAAGGVGIGGRGPGETKIEIDRRRVRTRMSRLRKEISGMTDAREVQRHQRTASVVPSVAIAGYTNAGKSSILNRLTGAGTLVDDALFATLDPTTRRSTTPDGRTIVLTDTVGFVRHLPHELIEAFRSTLEEVSGSDLLVHVVDASHPDPEGQISAVREVLNESGAGDLAEIIAINKADVADPVVVQTLHTRYPESVTVSARTGAGIDDLLAAIADRLPRPEIDVQVTVPYSRGDLVSRIHEQGEVLSLEHGAEGSQVHARVDAALAHDLEGFATENA